MPKKPDITPERYAAKLLFQFRVTIGKDSGKRRLCEERIIILHAHSANEALAAAKKQGKANQNHYKNCDGNPVHFEFVGILDLLHLGIESKPDEVWYDIVERLSPMERKSKLIPPESKLNAIWNEQRLLES